MLMISSPPQERRDDQPTPSAAQSRSLPRPPEAASQLAELTRPWPDLHDRGNYYRDNSANPSTPRHGEEYTTSAAAGNPMLGTARAAAALAELHERDIIVDSEGVCNPTATLSSYPAVYR